MTNNLMYSILSHFQFIALMRSLMNVKLGHKQSRALHTQFMVLNQLLCVIDMTEILNVMPHKVRVAVMTG